jgi:hypothetical protein
MKAAQHKSVAVPVEERQREALVAAGLLERVVANDADPRKRLAQVALEDGGSSGEPVDVPDDGADTLEVRPEDRLEALLVASSRDHLEPAGETAGAPEEDDRDDDEDRDGNEEARDEDVQVGGDEVVNVDLIGPPVIVRSLASGYRVVSSRPTAPGTTPPASTPEDPLGSWPNELATPAAHRVADPGPTGH